VEIISLTLRFHAVNNARAQEKPFIRLSSAWCRMHPDSALGFAHIFRGKV
jgi:hypothetical protein